MMGDKIWGPRDPIALCESCHKTEFMLHTIEFPDGEAFQVCGMCKDEAHRLLTAVFS